MKLLLRSKSRQHGSVLATGIIITAVIGVTLASYLLMCQNQNTSIVRSQVWNSSITLSEAGVEDGLAMINKFNANFDALPNWTNPASLSADNFTALGNNTYTVKRFVGNNSYTVFVTNKPPFISPDVTAIGTFVWSHTYAANSSPGYFATVGGVNVSPENQGTTRLVRKIEVRTRIDPVFNMAMAAVSTIDLKGNTINTDSFDSSNPLYSTNGLYPAGVPSKILAHGDVVSDGTIVDTISGGNAKIKGNIKTGPSGTVNIGPNGSVGDKTWVESGTLGIQPGAFADDMNVAFPIPVLPTDTSWTGIPTTETIGGVLYDKVLADGDYWLSQIGGTGAHKIYVKGHARLWVTTSISMSGSDVIRIAPTNAGLKLYMGGSIAKFGGLGVANESGQAASFIYFGLASNTSLELGGNSAFAGVIYAPGATFKLSGGGSGVTDFVGSSITKTVVMNGGFNFHYDEALKNLPIGRGFIPVNWKETTVTANP